MEEGSSCGRRQKFQFIINIFYHYPQNLGRMEEEKHKKFQKTWQNFGNVGRMEEVVEEENIF